MDIAQILRYARFGAALAALSAVAACAGAPVQEMSDARQAILAATEAGAEKYASADLDEARLLVKAAEADIQLGEYRQAREHANGARDKAMEARRVAEGVKLR